MSAKLILMTSAYNRSTFISYFELTPAQQKSARNVVGRAAAEKDSYVMFDAANGKEYAFALSSFMREPIGKSGYFKGIYCTSYFSAYVLYVSRSGREGVIAYQHY